MRRMTADVVEDSEDEDSMSLNLPDKSNHSVGDKATTSPIQTANFTARMREPSKTSTDISAFTGRSLLSQPPIAILPSASEDISMISPIIPMPNTHLSIHPATLAAADTSSSSHITSPINTCTSSSTNPTSDILPATTTSSVNVPKTRPKPRPAYKGASARNSSISFTTATSSKDTDSIQSVSSKPTAATSVSQNQDVNMTIDGVDMYTQDIAERAKLRSRARTSKVKGKQPIIDTSDIIDISSDDDELSFLPKPNASKSKANNAIRKSPRKRTKTSHVPPPDPTPMTLPIPTSDFNVTLSSQLPPSDPPPPSTASAPPSSTPPDPAHLHERDISPPSPLPGAVRKRKRVVLPAVTGRQGDDGEMHPNTHTATPLTRGEMLPPPPPPFFVSSSSTQEIPETQAPSGALLVVPADTASRTGASKPIAARQAGIEIVDVLPSTTVPKPKPRGRKKKADDDEEEWEGDVPSKPKPKGRKNRREDEDEEWGVEPPSKPKKGKKQRDDEEELNGDEAPPKPKLKKKDRTRGPAQNKMQMVVEMRSPGSRKKASPRGISPHSVMEHPESLPGPSVPLKLPTDKPTTSTHDSSELSSLSDLEDGQSTKKVKGKSKKVIVGGVQSKPASTKSKGKRKAILSSDEEASEEEPASPPTSRRRKGKREETTKRNRPSPTPGDEQDSRGNQVSRQKENDEPNVYETPARKQPDRLYQSHAPPSSVSKLTGNSSRADSIVSVKPTLMSELIRKVNSLPGSPFASPRPTYSPYLKSSRSLLKRIAPLHPNRKTPPPPLPRPPPPKKTKKQLDLEEKWEMELEESIDGWYCLPEEERAALRRAKRDAEMGFDD